MATMGYGTAGQTPQEVRNGVFLQLFTNWAGANWAFNAGPP